MGRPEYVRAIDKIRQELPKKWIPLISTLRSNSKELSDSHLKQLDKLRQEILDETEVHRSDTAVAIAVIAGSINAFCNLLVSLIGDVKVATWNLAPALSAIDEALINGKFDLDKATTTLVTGYAAADWSAKSPIHSLVNTLLEFTKKLGDVIHYPEQQQELKKEVQRQLDSIDEAIRNRQYLIKDTFRDPNKYGPLPPPHEVKRLKEMYERQRQHYLRSGIIPLIPPGAQDSRIYTRREPEQFYWHVVRSLERYIVAHREYDKIMRS